MKCRNIAILFALLCFGLAILARPGLPAMQAGSHSASAQTAAEKAVLKFEQGRHIFRFDTFGDQAFWEMLCNSIER